MQIDSISRAISVGAAKKSISFQADAGPAGRSQSVIRDPELGNYVDTYA